MKLETRKRTIEMADGRRGVRHDLIVVAEDGGDSGMLDLLGGLGTKICGEIRLSDGYGEHYLLIQSKDGKHEIR